MRLASTVDKATAEKVFATFVNCYTKTLTATDATIARGAPVILATHSASNNGYHIQRAVTSTTVEMNNLLVGIAADFPDTTSGLTGTWGNEDVGQVQVYGYNSSVVIRAIEAALVIGQILVPNSLLSGNLETCGVPVTASAATSTAAHGLVYGIGGLIYAASSKASHATNTTTSTAVAFIRCM